MFTLYSAEVTGNPGNCSYPRKTVVIDEASLKSAICNDYVCAEYKNNYRNGENFLGADFPASGTESQIRNRQRSPG